MYEPEVQGACCWEIVPSLYDREATHMNCKRQDCLNKACTLTASVHMLTQMCGISQVLTLAEESQAANDCGETRNQFSPRGEPLEHVISCKNIHI